MMWSVRSVEPANELAFSSEPVSLELELELDDELLWGEFRRL